MSWSASAGAASARSRWPHPATSTLENSQAVPEVSDTYGPQLDGCAAKRNLQPQITNSAPSLYALHPTPKNLHSTPKNSHSTPYTQNPALYTLHSYAYDLQKQVDLRDPRRVMDLAEARRVIASGHALGVSGLASHPDAVRFRLLLGLEMSCRIAHGCEVGFARSVLRGRF